jgi:hypothetical protein
MEKEQWSDIVTSPAAPVTEFVKRGGVGAPLPFSLLLASSHACKPQCGHRPRSLPPRPPRAWHPCGSTMATVVGWRNVRCSRRMTTPMRALSDLDLTERRPDLPAELWDSSSLDDVVLLLFLFALLRRKSSGTPLPRTTSCCPCSTWEEG